MVRQKLHLALFFVTFFVISLIEGIHMVLDLRFLYFILFILPLLLFILDTKKKYSLPKVFVGLIMAYFLFSFISLINSKQISVSIELFLRDVSLFLLMVYVQANSEEIKKHIPKIIIILSLVFIGVSGICFLTQYGRDFIRSITLNLLFNPAYPHKTIGDYLTFAIIICIYFIFVKKESFWRYPLYIFIPIFILSFSRTAYITLGSVSLLMLFIYRKKLKRISPLLLFSLIGNLILIATLLVIFVSTTHNASLSFIQNYLQKTLFIYSRPFLYSHLPFWIAGVKGFLLYPFVGIGQGNFQSISFRFTELLFLWSNTSFAILLDMLTEQGLFVALSFFALISYVIVTSRKDSIFYFLLVGLLISFMGFSAYLYTQIWMLFFIILGLVLEPKKGSVIEFNKNILYLPLCLGVVYMQFLALHYMYIDNGKRELAHKIYPYNKENVEMLITKEFLYKANEKTITSYLSQYQKAFSTDPYKLEYIGDTYLSLGKPYKMKALHAYEDSFIWGSYAYGGNLLSRMDKLYKLKKELQGEKAAKQYVQTFTREYRKILEQDNKKIQGDLYDNLIETYFPQR
ncbi:MAG: hypothetical protein WAV29_01745 [Microgenomates group bacterium]